MVPGFFLLKTYYSQFNKRNGELDYMDDMICHFSWVEKKTICRIKMKMGRE